mgnify:CR=1 FL=1
MAEDLIISPPRGAVHKEKRLGRGEASGHGKTCCRGGKGQTARAGKKLRPGFEGGQMPVIRRLPKTGFKNYFAKDIHIINLGLLDSHFSANDSVDLKKLVESGLINIRLLNRKQYVKVLADGEIKKPLNITAHFFSKKAEEKIKNVGGTVNRITEQESP